VTAFAIYREHTGAVAKTELAKFGTTLEQGNALATTHAQLPSRMIRSAVIFRDDFQNSHSLDLSWDYEVSMYGGYNNEFQVYTKESKNVYVANDLLYIKPTYTADDSRFSNLYGGHMDMNELYGQCTVSGVDGCHRTGSGNNILPPIMSGKVKSRPSLKYGYVTVRAKIPQGDWLWPAIWMLPKTNHYGGWPRSGEIDIMESRGNSGSYGVGHVSSNLHWGPDSNHNQFQRTKGAQYDGNWHNNFHVWKLEWTPTHLVTYIDDKEIMRVDPGNNFWSFGNLWSQGNNIWGSNKMAPFDQEFYMIFNLAVGGNFFNGNNQAPWNINEGQRASQKKFWEGRNQWQPTWHGDDVALMIDWVEFKSYY